jgi:hypothetical protein
MMIDQLLELGIENLSAGHGGPGEGKSQLAGCNNKYHL